MFSGSFSRGSEPTTRSSAPSSPGGGDGEVWGAALDWLQGGRDNVRSAVVELEAATETLGSNGS